MAKKDFSNTDKAFDALAEAVQLPGQLKMQTPGTRKERKTYTDEEAAALLAQSKTSGCKGLKLPRVNVAFPPDVFMYIKIMSRVRGETQSEFVNHILRLNMEDNAELYKKALEFKNSL